MKPALPLLVTSQNGSPFSESTISRQVARLADLLALDLVQKGKTKAVSIT